jgi:signal transduction histidine kinase
MLDSLIGLMPGHVYWKNLKGEFLGCNEAQAETARLTREEIIGKTDWEMPWAGMASQLRQNDLDVMRTKTPLTIEEEQLVDGVYYQYLSKKVPLIDGENQVVGVLGVSFDVTDQRRSEELKLQMRIANERADSMKVMASSIAHELRTPLSAIHSAMGWVKEEMPKLLMAYEAAKAAGLDIPTIHPRRIRLFDQICSDVSHESESANNIINMLLMKLGQTNLSPQDLEICSITACVNDALSRYPFPTEDHRKLVHWHTEFDFKFKGTPLLLSHVLFNLLKNSLYFIDEVGKGEISISLKQKKLENVLIFRDTAKGIPEKYLASIFEKFFSKTLHGSGIGLAFCKQVMHSFGGNIACLSVEGEFAEFILSFPIVRKEATSAA